MNKKNDGELLVLSSFPSFTYYAKKEVQGEQPAPPLQNGIQNGRYALWGENLFTGYPILLNPGFHCGDPMQVMLKNGKWFDTRIEMRQDGSWYLCDIKSPKSLNNIKVRVTMRYITT